MIITYWKASRCTSVGLHLLAFHGRTAEPPRGKAPCGVSAGPFSAGVSQIPTNYAEDLLLSRDQEALYNSTRLPPSDFRQCKRGQPYQNELLPVPLCSRRSLIPCSKCLPSMASQVHYKLSCLYFVARCQYMADCGGN